jgi:hypothetical protein
MLDWEQQARKPAIQVVGVSSGIGGGLQLTPWTYRVAVYPVWSVINRNLTSQVAHSPLGSGVCTCAIECDISSLSFSKL